LHLNQKQKSSVSKKNQGWPLYYFGQDGQTRGANKGISFPAPAIWPVPFKDIARAPQ